MKTIFKKEVNLNNQSHVCHLLEINDKKVKMTYESYNATERFTVDIFDGYKWNHFLSIMDLGVKPETSSYVWSDNRRIQRAEELFTKAKLMTKKLI